MQSCESQVPSESSKIRDSTSHTECPIITLEARIKAWCPNRLRTFTQTGFANNRINTRGGVFGAGHTAWTVLHREVTLWTSVQHQLYKSSSRQKREITTRIFSEISWSLFLIPVLSFSSEQITSKKNGTGVTGLPVLFPPWGKTY